MKLSQSFAASLMLMSFSLSANANSLCGKMDPISEADCAMQSAEEAEKNLNQIYAQLENSLQHAKDADGRKIPLAKQLTMAQKSWNKYRAETCKLEGNAALAGNPNRGKLYFDAETACLARLADLRAKELRTFGEEYPLW